MRIDGRALLLGSLRNCRWLAGWRPLVMHYYCMCRCRIQSVMAHAQALEASWAPWLVALFVHLLAAASSNPPLGPHSVGDALPTHFASLLFLSGLRSRTTTPACSRRPTR